MILFAPVQINLVAFKINSIDHNGTSNFGSFSELDVFISQKTNSGFGPQLGDANLVLFQTSAVLDSDLADSNAIKESFL